MIFPAAYDLNVTVASTPDGPEITASTALSFRCNVIGGTGVYQYQWSSNCSNDCFVNSQTTQSVARDAIHSTDSGSYTCVVIDNAGNIGRDSVSITVIGKCIRYRSHVQGYLYISFYRYTGTGIYVAGVGHIENNTILHANGGGRLGTLSCLSGAVSPNIGRWIGTDGTDLTNNPGW